MYSLTVFLCILWYLLYKGFCLLCLVLLAMTSSMTPGFFPMFCITSVFSLLDFFITYIMYEVQLKDKQL